ncbi:MAG: AraC family transcriptional regulator [Oscillospiraceae bacterium]|nr:AraC family transcriptional regulator [Oscillospiraceae bacterium]
MRKDIMLRNLSFRDINPLTLGAQKCAAGHSWGPSLRSYFLLHYVFSGSGVFSTPRGAKTITQGQLFVIRPDELCSYKADGINPWHYCWVGFESAGPLGDILADDCYDAPQCGPLFYSLPDTASTESRPEWFVCGRIYEILSRLGAPENEKPGGPAHYVRMACNYIESQYMENITVAGIAALLNLNRSYFSKIFRRHMGKSPQDYLVDFRLRKAAELLPGSGLTSGEVARMVGYADELNFSRMFKRKFGMPPTRFRRPQTASCK